jgi:TRAP-type mannitol/chloroaromatic compound transport system permease small subunit
MSSGPEPARSRSTHAIIIDRFCAAVDRTNLLVGGVLGASVILVTAMVIYEIVLRSAFNLPTIWTNESVIYLSAMTYLLGGGYTLLRQGHVRIDVLYGSLSARTKTWLDVVTFVFFLMYAGTLIVVGGSMAWDSFLQSETTGSPWNPPIWPVKAAIMVAGVLILLQGIANLLRELGWARSDETP